MHDITAQQLDAFIIENDLTLTSMGLSLFIMFKSEPHYFLCKRIALNVHIV